MLKLELVSKTYGNKNEKSVDNVGFEVRYGKIFGFLGPNSAGKTTTIKMMVSLLKPDSGCWMWQRNCETRLPLLKKEKSLSSEP